MSMMKSIGVVLMIMAACMGIRVQAAAPVADSPVKGPAESERRDDQKAAMAVPRDNPALPRVLLIGDSISIGYTVPVRTALKDKANVHRPPTNCQYTGFGLQNLKTWLGTSRWDVIHFNWGIWDTHYLDKRTGALIRDEKAADPAQIRLRYTPEEYGKNLDKLVTILEGTGAKLIWASSTPILSRTGDRFKDIENLNTVAAGVMKAHGIPVNDLYSLVLPQAAKWQSPDKVHFNPGGNKVLGDQVVQKILDALAEAKAARQGQR
jgi:hypothetical protein